MIFESDSAMMNFKNTTYAELMKTTAAYLLPNQEGCHFDHGKVWLSSARKEMEDGMNYLRTWSMNCKEGKEIAMSEYWSAHFGKHAHHDTEWQMYSSYRPSARRFSMAISHRNASIIERYILEESRCIASGPLSQLMDGPAVYDDFWLLEGVSYPN